MFFKYLCLIFLNISIWNFGIGLVESIADVEYEQVISDRYLFSSYRNESSWWNILEGVRSAWQVVSLPEYHYQSSQGFWLLIERGEQNSSFAMSYMSIFDHGIYILSEIHVNSKESFFVSSNNRNRMEDYSGALISPTDIQLIQCNQYDVRSCQLKRVIPFSSSSISKTKKIFSGLFLKDDQSMDWLYIGSDNGLHGLNLQTFEIIDYVNEINVSVSPLTVLNRIENSSNNLGSTAVAITNRGLTIIRFEMWTLRKKAAFFQQYIDESDRHVRYNLVSDCRMSKWE